MKNKGFTLAELLAVIVIVGILASVALISISYYMKRVNDEEKNALGSTIRSAYHNYRITHIVNSGYKTPLSVFPFYQKLTYSKKDCDLDSSFIYHVIKREENGRTDSIQEVDCVYLVCGENNEVVINDKDNATSETEYINGIKNVYNFYYCKNLKPQDEES